MVLVVASKGRHIAKQGCLLHASPVVWREPWMASTEYLDTSNSNALSPGTSDSPLSSLGKQRRSLTAT